MNFLLKVWRQANPEVKGELFDYEAKDISSHTSFLETLDIVNEHLTVGGEEPIAFDSDCREGIWGTCSFTVAVCPAGIPGSVMAKMFREYTAASAVEAGGE